MTETMAYGEGAEVDPYAGHTVCRPKLRCSQLFMLYQGRAARLTLPAFQFIRATQLHNRNIMMFRDIDQADYQRGISPEIPTMADFIAWQVEQRARHFPHATTSYCVGTSVGGYAAIASGYFLKVPIVWAFGPRGRVSNRLQEFGAGDPVSRRCWSLRQLLSEGNGVTEYRIFFNEAYTPDREIAEELADCPGVRLFPQPGDGHGVVMTMAAMGRLENLIVPFEASRRS